MIFARWVFTIRSVRTALRDTGVAQPLVHYPEHLTFALGQQPQKGVVASCPAQERGDDLGVERRAAGRHATERVREVVHI